MLSNTGLIVFSKDRAMQLDCLIRSLNKNAAGVFSKIAVVYNASDSKFMEGYNYLFNEHELTYFSDQNGGFIHAIERLYEKNIKIN